MTFTIEKDSDPCPVRNTGLSHYGVGSHSPTTRATSQTQFYHRTRKTRLLVVCITSCRPICYLYRTHAKTDLHELPWNPLSPNEVVQLFTCWNRFWCIAGGWALDLYAGELSRPHDDIDVLILRRDISAIHTQLPGWEFYAADPPGSLRRWVPSEPLPGRVHDIWCRPEGQLNWRFQFMVMDHDDNRWNFRRDWTTGGSLASLASVVHGVPVIAPEIQLLYKGNGIRRPKDEADFHTALPHLSPGQRAWLHEALESREPGHPWLHSLSDEDGSCRPAL